ncbi:MAG: adenine deaminase, partial [Pirellulaceae bacterium]|nr:adenine deaminase [Pirellulaceae bacterium]
AGVGPYDWQARDVIELDGRPVVPGLIDAHMHLESTLLWPPELARALVPHGTSAIIADPHEIANVLGIPGVEMMLAASEGLPLDLFFMAPSCVPATAWEDAGAVLDAAAVERLLQLPRVLGLAEVMDFPAVLDGREPVLAKVLAAQRRSAPVDGHAPGLRGQGLVAYAAAGIRADHESTEIDEALQKAALGMMVQVRQGSSEHNLETFLPLLVEDRLGDWSLATDDILPTDILEHGHINALLKRTVEAGVPPARAVRHATLVPARHYGLRNRGAVAPGYRADIVVMNDLRTFEPTLVVHGGQVVARDGRCVWEGAPSSLKPENTVRVAPLTAADLELKTAGKACPIVGLVPGQIVTQRLTEDVPTKDGRWCFAPDRDLALAACIERHHASGKIGLGLVQGFSFARHGALGSSVAHDSHNLIIAGTNPQDMLVCVQALVRSGGGFVAAADGQVLAELPLPIAGLMSTSDVHTVRQQLQHLHAAAQSLGCPLPSPFATLSFLPLPVIPELRVTPRGLFDVGQWQFIATV